MIPSDVDDDAIEAMIVDALERLPEAFRERLGSVAIVVEDEADAAQLASVGARGLYGLYQGIPRTRLSADALAALIDETVYHEIAHHFGISDERLHQLKHGDQ